MGEDKKGRGRPAYEPTDRDRGIVESMSGYGTPQEDIAEYLGIDAKTLRKYYRRDLNIGKTKANVKVAETLHHEATVGKNVAAGIWWTKTQMGWREKVDVNHGGEVKFIPSFKPRNERSD